mmetsp:Transcript_6543/g.15053  ORF Transcript_6543/g.15053 Transcript_6543/m.15053 type:complete len:384 (+) Transcript_6543:99-1250(+)|eukprot:CAMPEP_0194758642 /NCGR_PEP_ID=MMETSP0323_2-20130528/11860_1 /TAXON_ID=2866 ORGANISM="Crypthecodinium cohnii, Strain Seligo" /NCGR_SAMPLE_ID=MMETSP0323_2 /ASSEMBLY_ACC=CAM_ASM_000346 /LENGTH=383 /DNA_ID=CAMNT_0039679039 /DNA_START=18 /DNA_END=1169 /DNA_ORIENTATION=+
MAAAPKTCAIIGAGAIGGFYGLLLHKAGHRVRFLVRESPRWEALQKLLLEKGWHLGCSAEPSWEAVMQPKDVPDCFTTDPAKALAGVDYVLVATKRTENMAVHEKLMRHNITCPVVFLQNGINICKPLGEVPYQAIETVVLFNAVNDMEAGKIILTQERSDAKLILDAKQPASAELAEILNNTGVVAKADPEFAAIQSGKLRVNLINAVNALSGMTIEPMMGQAGYRLVLAEIVSEAMAVFNRAGIHPKDARTPYLTGEMYIWLLRAPQWVYHRTLARQVRGRGKGRTSMAQDLIAGRVPTEIDFLNGEIARMGKEYGIPTPANDKIIELIKEAERKNAGSPNIPPDELARQIGASPGHQALSVVLLVGALLVLSVALFVAWL